MELSSVSLIVAVLALIISTAAYILAKNASKTTDNAPSGQIKSLQLQAYERLVMLCERISLPTLISRTSAPQLSVQEMQVILAENIKQEFEYNASQQIYVSPGAWSAVQNLKDQNLLIINQVANILPPDAKGTDLNKNLLEVIMNQKEKALHTIVLEALNFEAKKLMK